MKSKVKLFTGMTFITLAACSTQQTQQNTLDQAKAIESAPPTEGEWSKSGLNPPLNIIKGDKTLSLVRIMDGGVCKNEYQGAKGEFLIYADTNDIERLKREKTPEIFKDFENKIQAFSSHVLQEAIEATNLSEDPFSLGEDESQEKLAKQLAHNFRNSVTSAVDAFQKETTLTIDVAPFSPSFIFYQKGCNMTRINPEG
jgi:hypothetical protein